jgi:hypothetical protein
MGEGVEIWNILESQGLKCSTCGLFKFLKKIKICKSSKYYYHLVFMVHILRGHMSQVAFVPRYLRCVFEHGSSKL